MSDSHRYDEVLSRRALLKAGLGSAVLFSFGLSTLASAFGQRPSSSLAFRPLEPRSTGDYVAVPPEYDCEVLLRWGDPLFHGGFDFDLEKQSAIAQAGQFGSNCGDVGYLPLPLGSRGSDKGLLVVNHPSTNPELMFALYNPDQPTKAQVEIEWAAHGISVAEVGSDADGGWLVNRSSRYNRRITAVSPMILTGPAAGTDWMKTKADPSGTRVLGALGNSAAGTTPWGTVLSAEESFPRFFANREACEGPSAPVHRRYGIAERASEPKWERFDPRFDTEKEPNEPNRFGWVVEFDPYDPESIPRKRTALGRFRHASATAVVTKGGQIALYSGDHAPFEYVYKFVSSKYYDSTDRKANFDLLDEGTLYVAKFKDDGKGEWLPLVFGEGPLTAANGFSSQADVLVNTRGAADLLEATKMDRPAGIAASPTTGKVFAALTSNVLRGTDGRPKAEGPNPRPVNRAGHILELEEAGSDHAATTFTWEVFMLCGHPADRTTSFAGAARDQVSPIACPSDVAFDVQGNLWIATAGMPGVLGAFDSLYAVPTEGPERGRLKMFFTSVPGAKVRGPAFTPDDASLFIAVQHPGEGGVLGDTKSKWPDGKFPRPSIVVVTK
jgi:uncharacterized protein